jgi:hypothetical protein
MRWTRGRAWVFVLGGAVLAALALLYARHASQKRRAAQAAAAASATVAQGGPLLRVPRCPGPITLDGDTDDPGWVKPPGPAKTGLFVRDDGETVPPYTQVRLVWCDDYLYMALYASDEDIESKVAGPDAPVGPDDDAFHILLTRPDAEYALDVSPSGAVTDAVRRSGSGAWDTTWNAGTHSSRELGGTVNDPRNVDEEWEVELALPLASLGMRAEPGESADVSFRRCDTPKESPRVCVGWGEPGAGRATGRLILE